MRRLEQVVQTIHLELQNIRRKEERMRDVNGALLGAGWWGMWCRCGWVPAVRASRCGWLSAA
jgi:hypothetical protein